jgi:hypothetical protein
VTHLDHPTSPLSRRRFIPALLALLAAFARPARATTVMRRKPHAHPDPRPGITGEHVLQTDAVKKSRFVAARYAEAREMPEVFDGLYCYCDCRESMGHRSLLACYESDQPIDCLMCQQEARIAAKAHRAGKSLDEVRAEVDKAFTT